MSEAKERLERIIASIQDAFISLDRNLRYAFVNDNAALLFGAHKEGTYYVSRLSQLLMLNLFFFQAMLGRDVWDFMVDNDEGVVRNNLDRAIREHIDVSFEFYFSDKDRWYEHRMYPSTEGLSIVTLDITARKKSEERLSVLAKVRSVPKMHFLQSSLMRVLWLHITDWSTPFFKH